MIFTYIRNTLSALKAGGSWPEYKPFFNRWKKSLQPGASSVGDRQPWITYPVIERLKAYLRPNMSVFEYGGGGSTLFFLDHVKEVVTVEHNQEWFGRLESLLTTEEKARWNGNYFPGEASNSGTLHPSDPHQYGSADPAYQGMQFHRYASYIDQFDQHHFDVVLVDGRARPSCIAHAIARIKPGGWLIVDNSDRAYYFEQVGSLLQDQFTLIYNAVAPSPYASFFTQTGVWQKR